MNLELPVAEYVFEKNYEVYMTINAADLSDARTMLSQRVADPQNYKCVRITEF